MKKLKILIAIYLLSLGSFANAKYLKYPSSCEYLKTKAGGSYSKKDIACYIKIMSAGMNKEVPKKSDDITTIEEIVPQNQTMIFKVRIDRDFSPKTIGNKKWKELKKLTQQKVTRKYCSSASPHLAVIKQGMTIKVEYKFKQSGYNVIVNKNSCK